VYSYVIIVLCGRAEQEAVDVLKNNLKRIVGSSSSPLGQDKIVRIFSKTVFKSKKTVVERTR